MTINFDPILAASIGFVIAVLVLVNLIAVVRKQKARQGKADDMLERGRLSQERNIAMLNR